MIREMALQQKQKKEAERWDFSSFWNEDCREILIRDVKYFQLWRARKLCMEVKYLKLWCYRSRSMGRCHLSWNCKTAASTTGGIWSHIFFKDIFLIANTQSFTNKCKYTIIFTMVPGVSLLMKFVQYLLNYSLPLMKLLFVQLNIGHKLQGINIEFVVMSKL